MSQLLDQAVDCPHREKCGACSFLRQPYGAQLERKKASLERALKAAVRLAPGQFLETLPSPKVKGYRNRAKMTISSDRQHRWKLGYFQRKTREVADAPHCGVLIPELLETTQQLRKLMNQASKFPFSLRHIDLRCGSDSRKQHMTLVVRDEKLPRLPIREIVAACPLVEGVAVNLNTKGGSQVIKGRIEPLHGAREVFVESAGLRMRVSPGSFFQVNLGLLPEIHTRMSEFFGQGSLLLDLYAGVGTHGLALRNQFERVLCLEGVRSAVADAKSTIQSARVQNVEVVGSPTHRAARRLRSESPSAVIINPSAAGADRPTLELIAAGTAKSVAYLSCDPETLARDLSILVERGFKVVSVQALDMMPQTQQVEALALLAR